MLFSTHFLMLWIHPKHRTDINKQTKFCTHTCTMNIKSQGQNIGPSSLTQSPFHSHTYAVPGFISEPPKDCYCRFEHLVLTMDFAVWQDVNQLNWGLYSLSTDNCLKTTISSKKKPLLSSFMAWQSWKGFRNKSTLQPSSPLFYLPDQLRQPCCWNGSPLWSSCHEVFLHVLTEESFLLFCPRISMSHLSIAPFILPPRGTRPALTLIQPFDVLMTLWTPIDWGHKFNCTWCKDACLWVTEKERGGRDWDSTCWWLYVCRVCICHLPELIEA